MVTAQVFEHGWTRAQGVHSTRAQGEEENKRMVKARPKPTPVKAAPEVIFDPMASGARKPRRPGAPSASKEWHSFMVCLSLLPSLWNIIVLLALRFLHGSMFAVERSGILTVLHFCSLLGIESVGYVSEASFGEICWHIWWGAWHWYHEAAERCWDHW